MDTERGTLHDMRDLAKSMIRLPWAMSMLMVDRAAGLATSREGWSRSAATLDEVSHAAEGHIDETVRGFYQLGDRLQTGVVDQMATGTRLFEPFMETAARVFRRTTGTADE